MKKIDQSLSLILQNFLLTWKVLRWHQLYKNCNGECQAGEMLIQLHTDVFAQHMTWECGLTSSMPCYLYPESWNDLGLRSSFLLQKNLKCGMTEIAIILLCVHKEVGCDEEYTQLIKLS